MIDRPGAKPVVELPLPGVAWKLQSLQAATGRLCQAADLLVLIAAFAIVAMLPAFDHDAGGVAARLQLTVSLRNAVIAAMCIATWGTILASVGIYAPAHVRSRREYILRCFIGLNCCVALAGLIELVLHNGLDVWHFVAIYWLFSLAGMVLVRAVLLLGQRLQRE
jgi:hypothetical protein